MTIRRYALFLVLLIAGFGEGIASWNKVGQFSQPISCGFFFNDRVGVVGSGEFSFSSGNFAIYRTTDGGNTWVQAQVPPQDPNNNGRITSIFMQDRLVGYASIMLIDFTNSSAYTLLRTLDGGQTWQDFTQGNGGGATCVHATSRAITITSWNIVGGGSSNNGASYVGAFTNARSGLSNGIDFLDDLNGVATMRLTSALFGNLDVDTYYTADGGVTWTAGGLMRESWGVYAAKISNSYFSMAEDNVIAPGNILYRSIDNGRSWQGMDTFPGLQFTGHIAGYGASMYVQTRINSGVGLMRSDDNGATWKQVGGPSNERDTRFCVGGCGGEVVYAFDNAGGVWKTTDGGDGTLTQVGAGSLPDIPIRSIVVDAHYCQPLSISFGLINTSCANLVLDSIFFEDTSGKFSIAHLPDHDTIAGHWVDSITLQYKSDRSEQFTMTIRVKGSCGTLTFDTLLTVTVSNLFSNTNGPIFPLLYDRLALTARYCQPLSLSFPLANPNCAPMTIDSVVFTDTTGEFTVTHTPQGTISAGGNDSISLSFVTQKNEQRTVSVRLWCTVSGRHFDTTLTIQVADLFSSTNGPVLEIPRDSLAVRTHYCQPVATSFLFVNPNCSELVIDTVIFGDTAGEFVVTRLPKDTIVAGGSDSISLAFQTDSNERRMVPDRLKCTVAGRQIDTTLWLDAFHSRSPEPYLVTPTPTKIGDTVEIALKILPPTDTVNIRHLAFHLKYDGDILTPAGYSARTKGTLSEHYKNLSVRAVGLNDLDCSIDLNDTITNSSDFSKPVILLRFLVTLTKSMVSPIVLDSFSIAGLVPLPLCTIPSTVFIVLPQCGDSTISQFMLDGRMPKFASIRPNPANGYVELSLDLGGRTDAEIEIVTLVGTVIAEQQVTKASPSVITLQTSTIPSGLYFIRLRTADGSAASSAIEIEH